MQLGVVFPQHAIRPAADDFRSFAQLVEGVGYRHLLVYDHVLGGTHENRTPPLAGPFDETSLFHEPFTLCSFLAAVTSTLELATGVLVLPQRQTALVAKQAAAVSLLTGGRFRLGVGVGWNHAEYEALGSDFSDRGRRQEEQIEVLRLLWTQPLVDFTGGWHRIDRMAIAPRPEVAIPIWLGGHSDSALDRSARVADGHIIGLRRDPLEVIKVVRENLDRNDRDPDDFGFDVVVLITDADHSWVDKVARVKQAGATKVSLSTQALDLPYEQLVELVLDAHRTLSGQAV